MAVYKDPSRNCCLPCFPPPPQLITRRLSSIDIRNRYRNFRIAEQPGFVAGSDLNPEMGRLICSNRLSPTSGHEARRKNRVFSRDEASLASTCWTGLEPENS